MDQVNSSDVLRYRYRPDILTALLEHGLKPLPTTSPDQVRLALRDLYRFEIRRLRDRLVRGDIPKAGYADRVVELRHKYPLLSLPVRFWLEPD
jgi:hypothetical protein